MTCVIPLLFVLIPCHEPTGRINSGGDGSVPHSLHEPALANTEGAGGREAPNTIIGTDGDDFIQGTDGPDLIEGGPGNDVICGGPCDPALIDRIQREGW
jgi:hypothetical protein